MPAPFRIPRLIRPLDASDAEIEAEVAAGFLVPRAGWLRLTARTHPGYRPFRRCRA